MSEKTTTTKENKEVKLKGKILTGVVVSDKMQDTIVVKVQRFIKHPKIGKYVKIAKKIKAHDAGNTAKEGDKVTIQETKPISKDKSFILVK
ncbi:30S ribosomal protein S17 [Patescibacteria group bacterium]|nr:30S ribosomal protein S17 [Patescibacteria group bacterium]